MPTIGLGTVAATPQQAVAGGTGRWTITYTHEGAPLKPGAVMRVEIPICWSPPSREPQDAGICQIRTTGRACLLTEIVRRRYLHLNLTGGTLRAGETIEVTYGAGSGAEVQPAAVTPQPVIAVSVDPEASGEFRRIGAIPIEIAPAPPAHVHVVAPTAPLPGMAMTVRLRVLDAFGNAVPADDAAELVVGGRRLQIPVVGGYAEGLLPTPDRGIWLVEARLRDLSLGGISNPVVADAGTTGVFWGDLHGHSTLSDASGDPAFYYRYARDVALLDFACLTDHDFEAHHAWFVRPTQRLDDAMWDEVRRLADRWNTPDRFVTFSGYEWTGRPYGDRTVHFLDEDGPIVRCCDDGGRTPTLLQANLPAGALLIAHTLSSDFMGSDWRTDWAQSLIEIYSMHGASEHDGNPRPILNAREGWTVRDALQGGRRFGIVCGSDTHTSQPGNPLLAKGPYRTLRYRGGLTAVRAGTLRRAPLFEGLRNRRCYGTTGDRIYLALELDDTAMGGVLRGPGPRHRPQIRITAAHTLPLVSVDLVTDREIIGVEGPTAPIRRAEFRGREIGRGGWAYVRAVDERGEMAWSSPIWTEVA